GSVTHTTTVQLTVTAPSPNFTISASPSSVSLVQGTSGSSTISTTVVGSGGTIKIGRASCRERGWVSVGPTSVNAGKRAKVKVKDTSAAAGSYTLTVTATQGSVTHTTTVQLTVTAPSPNFTISASPSSVSLVQGTSGSSTISTTVVGSGGTI